ncbi:hypothetical protein BpHYR1_037349 [Brachionus plicatilis]|uniref:Uncharacterized protein n=1 Tax=Brachionus plicatilis TaxID=10195 RepID=A0A3M7SAU2_BRAPC|nr:hypothetical protein BpHYR1_037349 [Brachionus plicatilis]
MYFQTNIMIIYTLKAVVKQSARDNDEYFKAIKTGNRIRLKITTLEIYAKFFLLRYLNKLK